MGLEGFVDKELFLFSVCVWTWEGGGGKKERGGGRIEGRGMKEEGGDDVIADVWIEWDF